MLYYYRKTVQLFFLLTEEYTDVVDTLLQRRSVNCILYTTRKTSNICFILLGILELVVVLFSSILYTTGKE